MIMSEGTYHVEEQPKYRLEIIAKAVRRIVRLHKKLDRDELPGPLYAS